MASFIEYIKAMGRAEILNNLLVKERNRECTREFILSLGFSEEEYRKASNSRECLENEMPSDLEAVMKFSNDLSTIIYTHNGMEYELYQAMNSLKDSADELRRFLSEEFGKQQWSATLGKLNVYYYAETIKTLRTYFDCYESIKNNVEKKQSILETCGSVRELILQKKQELYEMLHPVDFEMAFMKSQMDLDLKDGKQWTE